MHFTRVIRTDPGMKGLLFAGTEYGLYISFNDGAIWQPFQNNLPLTPITDLAVKDRHLIAATQGRSFWMIDDISPLYEIAGVTNESFYLFTPKPTYLVGNASGGKSKTAGENHPSGAIINFYLNEVDPAIDYRIEFLNGTGKIVRTFSTKPANSRNNMRPVTGANKFIWDLRTDGPDPIDGIIMWSASNNGPYIVPGKYTVKMYAGEEVREVPLFILQDPRNTAKPEDLQAQYDFIISGRDKINLINTAIREIRKVNTQLTDLKAKVKEGALRGEIDSLLAAGSNIEKALYQTQNRSAQDPLNYPIRLNNKYGHVITLAAMGFNRPTESMYGVKEELEKLIDDQLAKWSATKQALTELNKKVGSADIPFIVW